MITHNLKIGDAVTVEDTGIGVLTKQTKKYWYYFFEGQICRVSKEKLWKHIDLSDVGVSYGTTMKNRRKQKKSRTLDLHDTKHEVIEEKVKRFLNFIDLPCKIVTGKSTKMKEMVKGIVESYGWFSYEESTVNSGTLVVMESAPASTTK